jgi:guanylate kinase
VTARVIVLTAPSGGGKTTIAADVLRRAPDRFGYSVSATTRAPRAGERDGVAYHFVTRPAFQAEVAAGEFLEWAEYAGALYGTLKREVDRVLAGNRHVVLDIEVQGARQVRARYPNPASLSLFVLPPSPRTLIERLRGRRTESEEQMRTRLAIAVDEVRAAEADAPFGRVFDDVLVNDDLDTAVTRVMTLAERSGPPDRLPAERTAQLAEFARELATEAERFTQHAKRSP